jgi:hypothetical protein
VNNTCHRRWFCFSNKSLSINSNTSIEDYCETNLDDILHLKRTYSLDKSPRKMKQSRATGYIRKTFRYKKRMNQQTRSCCLIEFCNTTKKNIKEKKPLTFTQQIFAPIVTLKDFISTSSNDSEPVPPALISITPQSSYKSLYDPTPKSSVIHSYISLSNYRFKSNFSYSLEEQSHPEECLYCSSESALSNPNNNHFDEISIHSLNLRYSVQMYLSSNSSLNEQFDLSSISSEQQASIKETKQLSLCEINEIIYAIHSTIENNDERNETLDALASSLREVAEEIPVIDERTIIPNELERPPPPPPPPPGLGQILVRAVMYEIVMRLFSFYLLILLCCVRFT